MKRITGLFILAGLLPLHACQAQNLATPLPLSTALPSSTQTLPGTRDEPSATPEMVTPSPQAGKLVQLCINDLGRKLNIPSDQITLKEVVSVTWRDASLGCPKPGIDYIRAETPGYVISLETGGVQYRYHTDDLDRVVLCNKP